MDGIYVVEFMYDYTTQLAAFKTYEDANKYRQKMEKQLKRNCWITFYNFGEEFCCD